ncbi:MAG: hypothetical protein MJ212_00515, partial [Alphaproteobacteria bacterium]|nr:hypothetical protein [Alphaproteobacteria bacterium]
MSDNETVILDFEKTIVEFEKKIEHLKSLSDSKDSDINKEIKRLQTNLNKHLEQVYHHLTPWQKVQIARHPERLHCLDYVNNLIQNFTLLCGDRCFGDDAAVIGGIGTFENIPVVIIGQEKGNDLESRIKYNFGMAKPEGYRKAQRLMDMAEKLDYIDREYLSKFDYREVDSTIDVQKTFDKPVSIVKNCNLNEGEDADANTFLSMNYCIGDCSDKNKLVAFKVIEYVLANPGSSLKRALIESEIGKDVYPSFDDGILQPYFGVIAKDTNVSKADEFKEVLNKVFNDIVKN